MFKEGEVLTLAIGALALGLLLGAGSCNSFRNIDLQSERITNLVKAACDSKKLSPLELHYTLKNHSFSQEAVQYCLGVETR